MDVMSIKCVYSVERRNPFNRLRTTLELRPPLRRLRPTTVDVDRGASGPGQLRPPLTRATKTGHVHRALGKVDPTLTIGNPGTYTIKPGRSSKLSGT